MEYRELGKTGLKVSRLCFGALTIGPLQRNLSISQGAEIIREAVNHGVNFIDTADLYGTYGHIKEALKGINKDVVIASKSYDYNRADMKESLERARRELDRDYVDIFLLHEQESELTIRGHWEALDYLLEAKQKGLVKAVGISTHKIAGVEAATRIKEIDVIHPMANIEGVGITDGTITDMLKAIDCAVKAGKGIYAMKPLGGGHLHKRVEKAVRFVLRQRNLHSIAMGMYTKEEVNMNILLFEGKPIPAELSRKVSGNSKQLHIEDWCQGCGSCVEKCPAEALNLEDEKVAVNRDKCVLCGYCGAACPEFCLKII